VVMLAYAYTSHKLRQFKEARQSVDFAAVRKPQLLRPRDWPEVGCAATVKFAACRYCRVAVLVLACRCQYHCLFASARQS
jgi:hypothetical protein